MHAQVDLFQATRREPPPAPPPKQAPPPFVPDNERARHREARIVAMLRQRPSLLEDILRRSYQPGPPPLLPLSQSTTLADLRVLADEGVLQKNVLYALPGPLDGRWMSAAELREFVSFLRLLERGCTAELAEQSRQVIASLDVGT